MKDANASWNTLEKKEKYNRLKRLFSLKDAIQLSKIEKIGC